MGDLFALEGSTTTNIADSVTFFLAKDDELLTSARNRGSSDIN